MPGVDRGKILWDYLSILNYVSNGQTAGTTGRALQMEAIRISVNNNQDEITYATHVENIGWMDPVRNNEISGTTGRALQIEAIRINLGGTLAERCDIYYRSHVADIGWMGWAKNGADSGTAGGCKQMEAIEIVLLPKGAEAPGSTVNSFYDFNNLNVGPSSAGALRVSGNKLLNQNGSPIQLRGVSTHGLSWFPGYVNQPLFSELHNNWKANVVRLALYPYEYNGYCNGGDQNALKGLVKAGINYATAADMYVIVDWHVLNERDPNTYKEQAKQFFNEISSEYRGNNNVIYELCNEPNSGITWDSIKRYALEVIPIIRANDPDAIIIVGTPTWSQDVDQAAQNPITEYNNIMYAFHFYAATHKDDLRNKMVNAVNAGLPVFVSEFGICDASGNGGLDITSANQWINTLNANKISFVEWSLCNKPESASLINSSCNKLSGFSTSDLTQSGQWLLSVLSSPGLIGSEPEPVTPTPEPGKGQVEYSLKLDNSWESNNYTYYLYSFTVTNNWNNITQSWQKIYEANQEINIESFWNCNLEIKGNNLEITNADYNGILEPGKNTTAGFIIRSGPNLDFK